LPALAGQPLQPDELFRSATVLYVALAHSRQPDDWLRPSTAEYFPAPQFWQALTAVCAVSGWNVPARHRLQ
jgi:hypothetical protein